LKSILENTSKDRDTPIHLFRVWRK